MSTANPARITLVVNDVAMAGRLRPLGSACGLGQSTGPSMDHNEEDIP